MWLGCCGVYFQPSEPLKLLLIVYLAAYLSGFKPQARIQVANQSSILPKPSNRKTDVLLLPLLSPSLLMIGLVLAVLLAQRDLGTASIFLFIYTVLVFVATGSRLILLVSGLTVVAAGISGYTLFDVVRLRVDAWLNPWLDPSGRSYQIVQSLLSAANGGLIGRGLGLGSPGLVPVAQSDFIFTAIIEESGLLGGIGLLLIYGLLAARGLRIAINARDPFQRNLAAGLTAHLVAQSILIAGGNLRLFPLTGVTLPFVSYGGSSLLTSFLALLLLLKISIHDSEAVSIAPSNPHALRYLGAFLYLGLLAVSAAAGWWTFYRAPDLLTRTDNPRRAIADRDVVRGAIMDRNNQPIATTTGNSGNYTRVLLQPDLSPIIGYNNPTYGQAGVEAAFDDYLRGLKGNPGLDVWWSNLMYGQPPAGLNIRLSLDLRLQNIADLAMTGQTGGLVLLNAGTGEILAMASHPGFDSNQLDQDWKTLIQDQRAPLLNRAVQGRYPADGLMDSIFTGIKPELLVSIPGIGLQEDIPEPNPQRLSLSPLQAALASAALSDGGVRQTPIFVSAVDTPKEGWVILPLQGAPVDLIQPDLADSLIERFTLPGESKWQFSALQTPTSEQAGVWYFAGTNQNWIGVSYGIALYLEENNPSLAEQIGQKVLEAAMFP